MKREKPYKIILSGGGTGGHIFPAVAIANGIREVEPDADILFVGAQGRMEMEKVPKAGYRIVGLPVSAFHRRLTAQNLLFPFRLLMSVMKAAAVIREFKPDLVIGTGGFASGPILRAAARKGIPTLIQEQNSFPGVTNRILAKKAARICVAFSGMEKWFPAGRTILTGNPVRDGLALPAGRFADAIRHFDLSGKYPVIFVFGGSLGARTINRCILEGLERIAAAPVEVIWQTGTAFHPVASEAVGKLGAQNIRVREFIYEMDFAYALASLVVCRSGAITLSELAVLGKPAILVPLPSAAGDHQTRNARAFVDAGAARMVPDAGAPDSLVETMLSLVHDTESLGEMAGKMLTLARPGATREIVGLALELLTDKR